MQHLDHEQAKEVSRQFKDAIDDETWKRLGLVRATPVQLDLEPPTHIVVVEVEGLRDVPGILHYVDEKYHDNFRIEQAVRDSLPRQSRDGFPAPSNRIF